jgi:hypothetical protein
MKWVPIFAGTLVVLALALLAAVPYLVDLPQTQLYLAQSATRALGRPMKFSSVSLSVLPLPAVVLKDLVVGEDPRFGSGPFLSVGEGRLRLRLVPLLSRRVEFAELTLNRPHVELMQDRSGRWNVTSLGAAPGGESAPPEPGIPGGAAGAAVPIVSRIRIVDGTLTYQVSGGNGPAAAYRAEGMELTLDGLGHKEAVTIQGQAQVNPGDVSVRLDGALGQPLSGALLAAAPVKADISLDAKEMAPLASLFLGPSPDLSGPLKGNLALSGTLGRPAVSGVLESEHPTLTERRPGCPPPQTRRLTLGAVRIPFSYDSTQLSSHPLSAALGAGSVTLALDLAWEPGPLLSLKEITIKALPLAPVLVDYRCGGYAVSGPLDLTGEISGRPGNLTSTMAGQGQLRIGAGKVVGPAALALLGGVVRVAGALSSVLNAELPLSLFSSPLDFRSITASFRIVDGRLSTRDFLYTSERMTIAAVGEYGLADGRMNFGLLMTHGRAEIKAKVTGTAASASIHVLPDSILGSEPERVPGRIKKFFEGLSRQGRRRMP